MNTRSQLSRRRLLELGAYGSAAVASGAALSGLPSSEGEDYRALVCVFLLGGADTANLIVPRSAEAYATYAASRQFLAEDQNSLIPIQPLTSQGAEFGLNAQAPELAELFGQGTLAFLANTGPMVAPITKEQYLAESVPAPKRLFSHNDQQFQRQLAETNAEHGHGWCGRVADRMAGMNGATPLPLNITLAGPVLMQIGDLAFPYAMSPGGTVPMYAVPSGTRRRALFDALLKSRGHALEDSYSRTQREAVDIDELLSDALQQAPGLEGVFPAGVDVADQLRMVAKLISIRKQLGMRRQIFFVAMEGYDTHMQQPLVLPRLFRDLSRSLDAFQRALQEIDVAPLVTTFTASEFGRTLSSNGSGTDHGWGSHAMVMGAGVRGGEIYGVMPDLALEGPDDLGGGRILPTIAEDQVAATLATWFGLPAAELGETFPHLHRFASPNLGFLS